MKAAIYLLTTLLTALLLSCNNLNEPNLNRISLPSPIIISEETIINGGVFYYQVSITQDQSIEAIPNRLKTQVELHFLSWPNIIDVRLDDSIINSKMQVVWLNPFQQHTWYVAENQQYQIPNIQKTVPSIPPFEIMSPSMWQQVSLPLTITWTPPPQGYNSNILISIVETSIDVSKNRGHIFIPTDDDGSYVLSSSDLNGFMTGDTLKISIFRIWSNVDSIAGKNYLFATSFVNSVFVNL